MITTVIGCLIALAIFKAVEVAYVKYIGKRLPWTNGG